MADDRAVAFCKGDLLVVDDDHHTRALNFRPRTEPGSDLDAVWSGAMNLDGTRPNPGKTRVYLQKSRFTRKIPGRVPTNVCRARRHIAFSQGQCATCGAQRLLKYAHRTMCCRYACL